MSRFVAGPRSRALRTSSAASETSTREAAEGLGFRVWGFRVYRVLGLRVSGLEFRV